jgi:hypothetical protein
MATQEEAVDRQARIMKLAQWYVDTQMKIPNSRVERLVWDRASKTYVGRKVKKYGLLQKILAQEVGNALVRIGTEASLQPEELQEEIDKAFIAVGIGVSPQTEEL